jgi:hypothetical protein
MVGGAVGASDVQSLAWVVLGERGLPRRLSTHARSVSAGIMVVL